MYKISVSKCKEGLRRYRSFHPLSLCTLFLTRRGSYESQWISYATYIHNLVIKEAGTSVLTLYNVCTQTHSHLPSSFNVIIIFLRMMVDCNSYLLCVS